MGKYKRILPRDLFNESALLKCIGRLWIEIERLPKSKCQIVEEEVDEFKIVQDMSDGSISISNVTFLVGGKKCTLSRPLNNMNTWSLYLTPADDPDEDPVEVFDEHGNLTIEFWDFIN